MKRTIHFLFIGLCLHSAFAQGYDDELTKLSLNLGNALEKAGLKTVAISGFKDLQGKETGLGKLLVEDLSVDLVNQDKGVSVVDRANLSRLMEEYKLTEEGLVDPENTKKLKLAGIDAIILGIIVPLEQSYRISAKAIATDSAKVVAATRGNVTQTESLNSLMGVAKLESTTLAPSSSGHASEKSLEIPKRTYNLGQLTLSIKSIEFYKKTGRIKIMFTLKYNQERRGISFAYHLIDKKAPNQDYDDFNQGVRKQKGYKPEFHLVGEGSDDKGQTYTTLLPHDAISSPNIPRDNEIGFIVEYQVAADPGATIQIPGNFSFWLEFFAGGGFRLRQENNLYKWSAISVPIDNLY